MFKILVICVTILVNVEAAPFAGPDIFDDLYDYFFESDENMTVEDQTIYINCKNCTVKVNLTESGSTQAMVTTTAVPTTASTETSTTTSTSTTSTTTTTMSPVDEGMMGPGMNK
ncbi:unnamed protein product [Diamesa hyperborea]